MDDRLSHVRAELAPTGRLCVAINYGNPVLAQRDKDGAPAGVSAALARALAAELGVSVEFATFDAAGDVFAAIDEDRWRVAFLARDPVRAEKLYFTEPYVSIEGTYLVPDAAPDQTVEDLDRDGACISVGKGAAYDLFLTRTLTRASLRRAPTSADAVNVFVEQQLSAAAGVRQPLEAYAAEHSGYRVLPGRFTAIEQCIAVAGVAASGPVTSYVDAFMARMKQSDIVKCALKKSGHPENLATP
ncbi:transporter substrate-binding domain-containing protein [Larsenimonas salina]|uniref:transporter substrate-binding domain-containing protein n=1 Tax=Larsenimonas salina TaxID=1295565 RepID=UPI002074AA72|nr:transporter substrate-binding domain-containing protein [Larsenimonas salina]MCM5705133.1 transporter substrate-binding domain-containing protein [Larsenimonas salina]